ncbi:MAG: O-antigen ligase family protein, partial [Candidatus Komeilibacteria bacterium]|nr:O-antigen ligase family protein [Candidatus Komeilibacteria bacterium]
VWERFGSVVDWISLGILYFVLTTVLTTKEKWHHYFFAHTAVASSVALVGIAQALRLPIVYFDGSRIFSTLGNPAFLGAYLLLSIGIGVYCLRVTHHRMFIAVSVILQSLALAYTYTRSVLLGLSVALCMIACSASWHLLVRKYSLRRTHLRFAATGVVISGLAIIGIIASHPIRSGFDPARPTEIIDQTVKSRLINFKIAIEAFQDKPLFGWGTGMYPVVFQKYFDPRLYYGSDDTVFFDRSHNEFLDKAVETGIVGLLLWLNMLFAPVWLSMKEEKVTWRRTVFVSLIGGYAAYLFFSFSSIADSMLLMIILAFTGLSDVPITPEAQSSIGRKKSIQIASICIGLFLLIVMQLKPIAANILVRRGEKAESLQQAVHFFSTASGLGFSAQIRAADNLSRNLKQEPTSEDEIAAYRFLESILAKLIGRMPYDVRYLSRLVRVERLLSGAFPYKTEVAYSIASAAHSLSPRDPQLYHLRGLIQLDRALTAKDDDERALYATSAIEDFAAAYALAPHIHETAILYLIGTGYKGNDFGPLYDYVEKNGHFLRTADWRLVLETLDSFGQDDLVDKTIQRMRALPPGTAESIVSGLGLTGYLDLSQ